jgi:hypothetical protein
MAAFLAACRKHLAASCGLHARTESVRLGAPALARLISALWQSNPPLEYAGRPCKISDAKSCTATHAARTKRRFTSRLSGTLRIS